MPLPRHSRSLGSLTEILIQRRINHWSSLRAVLRDARDEPAETSPPVITVSRQAGSGGRSLARGLADKLSLPLHDHSLVERIIREKNLDPNLVAQLDEQDIHQTDLWIKGIFNQRIFLLEEYRNALRRTILDLAGSQGGVFLGRGAHLLLGDRADLRVRLVGSRRNRLERIMSRRDLSRAEARVVMTETDRRREGFLRKVCGGSPRAPETFDLTLNTDRLTPDAVLEMVMLGLLGVETELRGPLERQQQA